MHFILTCSFPKAKQVVALVSLPARVQPQEGVEAIFFVAKEVVEVVVVQVAITNITMEVVTKVKILTESLNITTVRSMAI